MSTLDINSKHRFTKSNKLRQAIAIKNYIVNKIDDNLEIKRLCRYLTRTPLDDVGQNYNGEIMKQEDLYGSLRYKTTENCSTKNQILIPYMFNDEIMDIEKQVLIFVHNNYNSFGYAGYPTSKSQIAIDILCPRLYNELSDFGQERIYEIACLILDMFDGIFVEEEYHDIIGCYKFKVEGDGREWRLSKKNNVLCYSFNIAYETVNLRS